MQLLVKPGSCPLLTDLAGQRPRATATVLGRPPDGENYECWWWRPHTEPVWFRRADLERAREGGQGRKRKPYAGEGPTAERPATGIVAFSTTTSMVGDPNYSEGLSEAIEQLRQEFHPEE